MKILAMSMSMSMPMPRTGRDAAAGSAVDAALAAWPGRGQGRPAR